MSFIKLFFISGCIFLSFSCGSKELLHEKLKEMSQNINQATPVMLDHYTRFDETVVTPENEFQYYYTVLNTADPDSLIGNKTREIEQNIKEMLKTHPDLRIFVKNKVPLEYIYRDSTTRVVHSITISSDFYSK